MPGGEAEPGLKRGHVRAAAVEAEHELVDTVWQVLGEDDMMGAELLGLEVSEGAAEAAAWPRTSGRPSRGRPVLVLASSQVVEIQDGRRLAAATVTSLAEACRRVAGAAVIGFDG